MSHLSLPQLAKKTGLTRRHLQRLAADGTIPGATRTPGGHWRIDEAQLGGWLAIRRFEDIRRRALSRNASRDAAKRVHMAAGVLNNNLILAMETLQPGKGALPSDVAAALYDTMVTMGVLLMHDAQAAGATRKAKILQDVCKILHETNMGLFEPELDDPAAAAAFAALAGLT
jgi:excisionase family DNA binding protein